jgi:hypothetical protein
VESHKHPQDATIETQLRDFIIKPLSELHDVSRPLVIVIDALDECNNRGGAIPTLLRLLGQELAKLSIPVKFLITSRPEQYIAECFNSPTLNSISHSLTLHEVETSVIHDDIRQFFRLRLADVHPGTEWPPKEQLDALVTKSSGLFAFAGASVDFIKLYGPDSAQEQLDILLQAEYDISAFGRLDTLYRQILEKAISPKDDKYHQILPLFEPVVGAVSTIFDPLSVPELERLLQLKPGHAKRILHALSSIIVVSADDNIRPWHPTFPEFLTNKTRCTDERFYINPAKIHELLALRCFEAMNSFFKANIDDFTELMKSNENHADVSARIEKAILPEVKYAWRHWASHLMHASPSAAIVEQLGLFLSEHFEGWLQVLDFIGQVDLATDILADVRQWAKNNDVDEDLLMLIDKAERHTATPLPPIYDTTIPTTGVIPLPTPESPFPCETHEVGPEPPAEMQEIALLEIPTDTIPDTNVDNEPVQRFNKSPETLSIIPGDTIADVNPSIPPHDAKPADPPDACTAILKSVYPLLRKTSNPTSCEVTLTSTTNDIITPQRSASKPRERRGRSGDNIQPISSGVVAYSPDILGGTLSVSGDTDQSGTNSTAPFPGGFNIALVADTPVDIYHNDKPPPLPFIPSLPIDTDNIETVDTPPPDLHSDSNLPLYCQDDTDSIAPSLTESSDGSESSETDFDNPSLDPLALNPEPHNPSSSFDLTGNRDLDTGRIITWRDEIDVEPFVFSFVDPPPRQAAREEFRWMRFAKCEMDNIDFDFNSKHSSTIWPLYPRLDFYPDPYLRMKGSNLVDKRMDCRHTGDRIQTKVFHRNELSMNGRVQVGLV